LPDRAPRAILAAASWGGSMTPAAFKPFFANDVAAMIRLAKDAEIKPLD
jgi:hypothetical protein